VRRNVINGSIGSSKTFTSSTIHRNIFNRRIIVLNNTGRSKCLRYFSEISGHSSSSITSSGSNIVVLLLVRAEMLKLGRAAGKRASGCPMTYWGITLCIISALPGHSSSSTN
jgi:hypothetical protein